jgi:hypothetical protein
MRAPVAVLVGLVISCGGSSTKKQLYDGASGRFPPPICHSDSDCLSFGRHCELSDAGDAGEGKCTDVCDNAICRLEYRAHYACDHGSCAYTVCSADISCADGERCDPVGPQCVAANGQCSALTDCPTYDKSILAIADRWCDPSFGYCRLSPKKPTPAAADLWPSGVGSISVTQPQPGQGFPTAEDAQFVWQQTDQPVLLFALTSLPRDRSQISLFSIWGAAILPVDPTSVKWTDGVNVTDGQWGGVPAVPPPDPLYLLIVAVEGGQVRATSDFVPFRIGSSWPQPGADCADESAIPGSCENPSVPMSCLDGTCRRLCLSNYDCEGQQECSDVLLFGLPVCVDKSA